MGCSASCCAIPSLTVNEMNEPNGALHKDVHANSRNKLAVSMMASELPGIRLPGLSRTPTHLEPTDTFVGNAKVHPAGSDRLRQTRVNIPNGSSPRSPVRRNSMDVSSPRSPVRRNSMDISSPRSPVRTNSMGASSPKSPISCPLKNSSYDLSKPEKTREGHTNLNKLVKRGEMVAL